MEVKLFIGNLSFSTREEDLRALLDQAGTVVSLDLIKDRFSGESKGFAFAVMGSQTDAAKAIQMYNGYSLDNRQLKVGPARERESSGGGHGDYNGKRGYGSGSRRPGTNKNRGGTRRF